MDSWGLSETEPPSKEHAQARPGLPHTHVADEQLSLQVCPVQLERGLALKLLSVSGLNSSSWAALSGLGGREYA